MTSISGLLPGSYWLKNVVRTNRRVGGGAEASIYCGTHNGLKVVIREPNLPDSFHLSRVERTAFLKVSNAGILVRFQRLKGAVQEVRREIVSHWQLRHKHIIGMVGIYQDDGYGIPSMILPHMEHGKASDYLRVYGGAFTFLEVVGVSSEFS